MQTHVLFETTGVLVRKHCTILIAEDHMSGDVNYLTVRIHILHMSIVIHYKIKVCYLKVLVTHDIKKLHLKANCCSHVIILALLFAFF